MQTVSGGIETLSQRRLESFHHYKGLNKLFLHSRNRINIPNPKEIDQKRTLSFIEDNDKMANILSQDDQMLAVIDREKDLKGDCKLGIVICIDGRISILHQFGKTANTWEVAGSQIEIVENEGEPYISSRRLIGALEDTADEAIRENRDLLEIVTAHTGETSKCGKIGRDINQGLLKGKIDDVALQEAKKRSRAIENSYNEILESKGKSKLDQVAVTAMIDTDTMGFILNYGAAELELSTTKLLMENGFKDYLESQIKSKVGTFGSMRDSFTNMNSFIEYSEKVVNTTEFLLNEEINREDGVIKKVQDYIGVNFPKLTDFQKKVLQFNIARSIANQYVTGLADKSSEHPYSKHREEFLTVSPNGKPFGRHNIESPSFGSTPKDRNDMLEQVKIGLSIIDAHKNKEDYKPNILFISNPIDKGIWDSHKGTTYHAATYSSIVYYNHLLGDSQIRERVNNGSLILVPVLVDDQDGRVLEIMDYSNYADSIQVQKTL